ncbi:MAG: hypothetical protein K6D92_02495 [Erysipelotrichaceae bacterium]|jgi:hypothetical protein|nr:hypothetical protein [Erysipelotrichaceae bacterium]
MGEGIDFDKLSIEERFELLQEQEDDAQIAMSFLSVDEKVFEFELGGFAQRTNNFTSHLNKLIDVRDFSTTDNMMKALYMNDLGDSGWIRTYYRKNGTTLSYTDGRLVTSDYDDDEIRCLNTGREYLKDIEMLSDACYHVNKMLRKFPLEASYNYLCWVDNFSEGDYDEDLYARIDTQIETVDWQLSRTREIPAGRANDYAAFYALKIRELENQKSQVMDEYYKRRLQDYQEDLKKRGLDDCIKEPSPGKYEVRYDWSTKMQVIDNYTNILTRQTPTEDKMKEIRDECTKLMSEKIRPYSNQITHKPCQDALDAMTGLVREVQRHAMENIDTHEEFADGKDAPFCFMKNPPSLDSATSRYDFKPSKAYPWDHGTELKKLYEMIADALTSQCKDFVYNQPLPAIFR